MIHRWFLLLLCACGPSCWGCRSSTEPVLTPSNESQVPPDGQSSDHQHGPHGGHLAPLSHGQMQVEWVLRSDRVIVYLLADDGQTPVAIDAPVIHISSKLPRKAETDYVLKPTDANSDDPPRATTFETRSSTLATAIKHPAATTHVSFNLRGKHVTARLESHTHSH